MVSAVRLQDVLPVMEPKEVSLRRSENAGAGSSFGEVLVDAVKGARANEAIAGDLSSRFVAGDTTVGLHEVMIASEKASISVRYAVTLKNRALEAYRELMNTPV